LAFLLLTDPPTTELSTLSLHDALPIYPVIERRSHRMEDAVAREVRDGEQHAPREQQQQTAHPRAGRYVTGTRQDRAQPDRPARRTTDRRCSPLLLRHGSIGPQRHGYRRCGFGIRNDVAQLVA